MEEKIEQIKDKMASVLEFKAWFQGLHDATVKELQDLEPKFRVSSRSMDLSKNAGDLGLILNHLEEACFHMNSVRVRMKREAENVK